MLNMIASQDANLWDISIAPTIVMTQRGARRDFQSHLLSKGVEVVQFDFLTPEAVASYCVQRGFLQCLWECGGKLAAPAIAGGAIHKCLAFVAPKLVSYWSLLSMRSSVCIFQIRSTRFRCLLLLLKHR